MSLLVDAFGNGEVIDAPPGVHRYPVRYGIGERTLYNFDPQTSVLQVSMSPADVEILLRELVGELPPEGRNLRFPYHPFSDPARFEGVKRIEPLPDSEGRYMMRLERIAPHSGSE